MTSALIVERKARLALLALALPILGGCSTRAEITDLAPSQLCWGSLEECAEPTAQWERVAGADAAFEAVTARTIESPLRHVLRFPLMAGPARTVRVEGGRNARRVAFDGAPREVIRESLPEPIQLEAPVDAEAVLVESRRAAARSVWPFKVAQGDGGALVADTLRLVLAPTILAAWCLIVAVLQLVAATERRSRVGSLLVALEAGALAARFVAMQNHWTTWWSADSLALSRRIEYVAIPVVAVCTLAFYRWLAPNRERSRVDVGFMQLAAAVALAALVMPLGGRTDFLVLRAIQLHAGVGLVLVARAVWSSLGSLPREIGRTVLLGVGSLLSAVAADLVTSLGSRPFFLGIGFVALGFVVETTCQAVVVSMQNRRAHDRVDELAGELEGKNDALARANVSLEGANAKLENANAVLAAELDERRRVQGELEVATQQLTQAENMATLGMLMAGIAHDIRNPLNYVQGAAEQLRSAIPDLRSDDHARREKTVARVEKVVGWVEQGTASMDAISLAMRNQARSGSAEFDDVNPREIVLEALLLCRSRTKACDVEVDVQDATIRADATGLGQLVMNLVSNAADAIAEAREANPAMPATIRVSARTDGDGLTLAVEDSGSGIPEHVRARILEPFFTTKPRGQGTGLGLAIVHRVVKQHGGTLEIARSEALGGARFSVRWGQT
jgi:signal transduction histidine kinase